MPKNIEGEDQAKQEAKEAFNKDLKKITTGDLPENVLDFLGLVRRLHSDEKALEALRQEIVNRHGK